MGGVNLILSLSCGAPEVAGQLEGRSQLRVPERDLGLLAARRHGERVEMALAAHVGLAVFALQGQSLADILALKHVNTVWLWWM